MIARLSGILAETAADSAVIDVAGVGYLVHLQRPTLDALGPVGGEVLILTELQVREDAWTLFGFGSAAERDSFRALTSSRASAARLALAILSVLSPDELARAVAQDDKAMIGRANGVGPKLAARIANELQGKLGVGRDRRRRAAPRGGAAADALSALANLGFKPAEASAAVNAAQDELGTGRLARRAGAARAQESGEVTAAHRLLPLRPADGDRRRASRSAFPSAIASTARSAPGASFAVQARWPAECVTIDGQSKSLSRTADSGSTTTFHFCPDCGSDRLLRATATSRRPGRHPARRVRRPLFRAPRLFGVGAAQARLGRHPRRRFEHID